MSNITQVVGTDKNMTTMNRGVIASGLNQILSDRGPYTLFAPSDLAFGKLDTGMVENLLKPENKLKLTSLLNHHVIPGKFDFKDFQDGQKLKTLDGKELSIKITNGQVSIDGAMIQNRDVKSSNGVIHSVDKVLSN